MNTMDMVPEWMVEKWQRDLAESFYVERKLREWVEARAWKFTLIDLIRYRDELKAEFAFTCCS